MIIHCPNCNQKLHIDPSLTEGLKGRVRQFHRLLISHNDFKQAIQIANYILDNNLPEKCINLRGKERSKARILWQALNCAMIVAYTRPFSGNDKGVEVKIPDLPESVLKVLNDEERKIHGVAMDDRNSLLAHSDSSAWNLRTFLLETDSSEILIPLHHDARAPLTREATEILKTAAEKLMKEVFRRRGSLQEELRPYLPRAL